MPIFFSFLLSSVEYATCVCSSSNDNSNVGIIVQVIAVLAVIGVVPLTGYFQKRFFQRQIKIDVIRKLSANKGALVPTSAQAYRDEFYSALNEIAIAFASDTKVKKVLKNFISL